MTTDVPGKTKTDRSAVNSLLSSLPGATIQLTKKAKDQETKEQAKKAPQRSSTFSLFGIGGGGGGAVAAKESPLPAAKKPKTAKTAPRGVPTIKRWKQNRDGTVSGLIYSSPNFDDGERVTTSAITQGNLSPGEVVKTGSGSRYFLE